MRVALPRRRLPALLAIALGLPSLVAATGIEVAPPAVVNASLERDDDGNGVPDGWRVDAWGNHRGTAKRITDEHTGRWAHQLTVTKHVSGDRKLLQTAGAAPDVVVGHRYELSLHYKASTTVVPVVFTRTADGGWRYWSSGVAKPEVHRWTEVRWTTAAVPSGVVELAFGMSLPDDGTLKVDDLSIRDLDTVSPEPVPVPDEESTPTPAPTEPAPAPVSDNPFVDAGLFVDPSSAARHEAARLRDSDPVRAELFDRIGDHAQADWFGDWIATGDLAAAVRARVDTIRSASALPVFVTYAIPSRDCGGYSAGGVNTPDGYRDWVTAFAAGLDGRPAAVIVEPDALAQLDCLSAAGQQDRLALLDHALDTLAARGATVYLDAGHSGWHTVSTMASRLRAAGVDGVRGFALNVSNYRETSSETTYARELAAALGGGHAVVDTSRNGLGPAPDGAWCNPDGRALGERPAAVVGDAVVDAHLWVKRPGESDGSCNGGPAAGQWWPAYAEGLASRATWAS